MKPNFALVLSFDGIGLLHRAAGGWHSVGDVSLDAPDLAGALAALRRTAVQLDHAGLRSKLVIPNEQIRYLSLPAPARGTDMAAHVAASLDGTTPYAVADLRYDWVGVGDRLHVAAVARETLDEAEAFATDHGFAPVSFVAIPAPDSFPGEPFFGLTTAAADLIAPDDRLMRDTHAIRILGAAELPEAPTDTTSDAPAEEAHTDEATPPDTPATDAEAETTPPVFATRRSRDAAETAPATSAAPASGVTRPVIEDLPDAAEAAEGPEDADATDMADEPAPPARRKDAALVASRTPPPAAATAGTTAGALRPEPFRSPPPPPQGAPSGDSAAGLAAQLLARLAGRAEDADDDASPPDRTARDQTAGAPSGIKPSHSERQRLTVFGARRPETDTAVIGGKPRFLGLILTGALLLFLAAVAAWSAMFTEAGIRGLFGGDRTEIAETAPAPQDSPPDSPPDSAENRAEARPQPPGPDSTEQAAQAEDPPAPLPLPVGDLPVAQSQPVDLSPEAARQAALASYAATGIWQIAPAQPAPPVSQSLDTLYLASIDSRLQNLDAVALPDMGRAPADRRPEAQSSPAAPGTRFDMDTRGLVVATPEGAQTPDGVIVFAGRPAVTPPGIPTRFAATPQPDAQPEPQLASFRPRLRPETLVESNERATLGGLSRSELAGLRPRARPETLAAVALALREADEAEASADEADAQDSGTDQAIATSLKPLARPRDLAVGNDSAQGAPQQVASATALAPQRNAAPQIPSSASVAQQATVRGAINLRQVNLIGVYGQPSNRRALVRLSNGRYQKVQVGDRLDGGQVRAIGENELSYVKNNRAIVLTMPQG